MILGVLVIVFLIVFISFLFGSELGGGVCLGGLVLFFDLIDSLVGPAGIASL
jgi:hypothetical protein